MKTFKRLFFYVLVITALLFLGYYRDFLFKKINALLQAWDYDLEYVMPNSLRFFENMNYETIVNVKWLLTLVFSLLYLIISMITIKVIFKKRKYTFITIATYIGIVIVSSLFIIIGILFKVNADKMYEFARYFMGMAQSPIVLMILIPIFKLSEKEKKSTAD